MEVLWLVIDLVVGLVVAGIVAPFALFTLPDAVRGPKLLFTIAAVCVIVASILRRLVVGTPGTKGKG